MRILNRLRRRPTVTQTETVTDETPWPEWMYVEWPDGTIRRCRTTPCPEFGFPTTPGFNRPEEWEIVGRIDENNMVQGGEQ